MLVASQIAATLAWMAAAVAVYVVVQVALTALEDRCRCLRKRRAPPWCRGLLRVAPCCGWCCCLCCLCLTADGGGDEEVVSSLVGSDDDSSDDDDDDGDMRDLGDVV